MGTCSGQAFHRDRPELRQSPPTRKSAGCRRVRRKPARHPWPHQQASRRPLGCPCSHKAVGAAQPADLWPHKHSPALAPGQWRAARRLCTAGSRPAAAAAPRAPAPAQRARGAQHAVWVDLPQHRLGVRPPVTSTEAAASHARACPASPATQTLPRPAAWRWRQAGGARRPRWQAQGHPPQTRRRCTPAREWILKK